MATFQIHGGTRLCGSVRADGRKNSAVAVLPAALLAGGPVRLDNLPQIADVALMVRLLRAAGARVVPTGPGAIEVDPRRTTPRPADERWAGRMRASYYLIGALLARFGEADVPLPGGCNIGVRPIDQHLKGLQAMGAEIDIAHGRVRARATRLRGAHIYLDVTSVGATINLMLAASRADGITVIENAAKEPHVVDVASLLLAMGATVIGAGTDVIKVRGRQDLRGCEHAIIPDEIEAATFMVAAAGSHGDVTIENVIPRHLEPVIAKLREAGAEVTEDGEWVRVRGHGRCRAVNVKTLPYPGFPTDAQQLFTTLLTLAGGTSTVTDTIWDGRFRYVEELLRMGARIQVEGRTALVTGVRALSGARTRGHDLRGAAALVLAGVFADGDTEVDTAEFLDRGYAGLDAKLCQLGARVTRCGAPGAAADLWPDLGGHEPANTASG